jgi:putative spermidine/putrescine transport system permease protein
MTRLRTIASRLGIAAIYLFLLAPVIVVVITSFGNQAYLAFPPHGVTLEWYHGVLHNAGFASGFRISLTVGGAAAGAATVVGVAAAVGLSRSQRAARLMGLYVAPLLVPQVVLGLALLFILAPIHLAGRYSGLVIAHLAITIPYVIRMVWVSLSTTDRSCEDAARTLGAGPWTAFRRVTLPLIRRAVVVGAVLAFIVSFDDAVVSLFVADGTEQTLPLQILSYIQGNDDPQIAALSTLLLILSIIVIVIVERTMGRGRAWQIDQPTTPNQPQEAAAHDR